MNEKSKISCCKFVQTRTTGGAILLSSSNLQCEIENSLFSECSSALEGGAVYISQCNTSFINNFFTSCYSLLHQNNRYGNAIFNSKSLSDLNESSFLLCGPDAQHNADSCVYMYGNKFVSILNNGTNNYGSGGGCLVSLYNGASGTFVKFDQVYKCFDWYFIEFPYSTYTASYCNFIDASGLKSLFWVSYGTATFENCTFINASGKEIENVEGAYNFINCFANENIESMIYSPFVSTYKIKINFKDCKFINCSVLNQGIYLINLKYILYLITSFIFIE